jgi:site-specific DNA-methyltransferase (adenine-specific)
MDIIMIITSEQYEKLAPDYQKYFSDVEDWTGWGSALKPAFEPIVMARKPIPKGSSIAKNCQQYGTGAINVDACRIAYADVKEQESSLARWQNAVSDKDETRHQCNDDSGFRFSSSTEMKDTVSDKGRFPSNVMGAVAGYEKFFYQPKVSRKERHCGMGDVEPFKREDGGTANGSNGTQVLHKRDPQEFKGNNHPTVKPVALMDYLIKLVTPPSTPDCQRKVLDPFMGSGSTGMAAVALGHHFTGCELDANYVAIAEKRITAWNKADEPENNFDELFDV